MITFVCNPIISEIVVERLSSEMMEIVHPLGGRFTYISKFTIEGIINKGLYTEHRTVRTF
jgi:hypothetical protein